MPRGKTLEELTLGETALLAGLISNPEGNSPFTYPDRAIRRRADVLRGMVDQKYITQAEADAANNEPLPTQAPPAETRPSDFLTAEVQNNLLNDPRLGNTEKERLDKVYKGGLKVYTTFDPALQRMAIDATTNAKPQYGPDWASSLVAIDPAHRRGEGDGLGPGLRRRPDQHRHLALRSPDRLDVQGDHARRRARQRLLAAGHRRRHEPVRRCPPTTAQR